VGAIPVTLKPLKKGRRIPRATSSTNAMPTAIDALQIFRAAG
jgi:hypothetical protein